MYCQFCNNPFPTSLSHKNHEYRCPQNPNRNYVNGMTGKRGWNRGLTKETDCRIKRQSEKVKGIKRGRITAAGRSVLSKLAKERGLGGYRPHPNRGEYYKGIWFDSKWEVKLAQSLDEHSIEWTRPRTGFVWNELGNKYYPDFYLKEYDLYLDPKNEYLMKKDKVKIESAEVRNNIRVIVLSKEQLNWAYIKNLIADVVQ